MRQQIREYEHALTTKLTEDRRQQVERLLAGKKADLKTLLKHS